MPRATAPPAGRLTWPQVIAWRVRRHQLHTRAAAAKLLDVTERIGGLHAQLMSSAELTASVRLKGMTRQRIRDALWKDRTLVKTWAMRGTLHLLTAREYGLWIAAFTGRRNESQNAWLAKALEITPADITRIIEAVGQALDGDPLTREELADAVAKRTRRKEFGDLLRSGWGSMLKPAASRGSLCFAPSEGQKVRFTRPDRWIGPLANVDPAEAEREVTRRFFTLNGPATRDDFTRWWGVLPPVGRRLVEGLGDELVTVDVEGARALVLARDLAAMSKPRTATGVRLLPAFDQYVVGVPRRETAVISPEHRPRVYRPNAWFSPVLLVDGRMVGSWSHALKGKRLAVTIEPFAEARKTVTKAVREAGAEEAERLASFLDGELDLTWAT